MFVVAFVVAGLLKAACVGSLINTKVEIVMDGIRFVGLLVFVDVGLDCVGSLFNTRV